MNLFKLVSTGGLTGVCQHTKTEINESVNVGMYTNFFFIFILFLYFLIKAPKQGISLKNSKDEIKKKSK